MSRRFAVFLFGLACAQAACAAEPASNVALITALDGKVVNGKVPLAALTKLGGGETLTLAKGAHVQVVYFDNGRQESWTGPGRLSVGANEGQSKDMAAPEVRQLPLVVVKQIGHTPALSTQAPAGAMRLRGVPTQRLDGVQEEYARLRDASRPDDLTADIYLLASLYELQDKERLSAALTDLRARRPDSPAAAALADRYERVMQ